jgi:hypothetical protein
MWAPILGQVGSLRRKTRYPSFTMLVRTVPIGGRGGDMPCLLMKIAQPPHSSRRKAPSRPAKRFDQFEQRGLIATGRGLREFGLAFG